MKHLTELQASSQMNRHLASLLASISLFVLVVIPGFGQLSTASLNGVVRDPSGAVIANANVVLRNVDTAVEKTTVSNSSGDYLFTSITPGRYTIEASATGFSPKQVSAFQLTVGQIGTIDFVLSVGSSNQVVNVEASSQQIDLHGADLGATIATRQVNELPLNGRNFTQLLQLTPGVVPIMTGQNSGMNGNGGFGAPVTIGADYTFPAVNGQTNRSNMFLMDGLNNYGAIESTYAVPPIVDAIQEFKVVSHTDSAEFGSVLGGVVNVATKSGTNDLHGSAWEYVRNNIFDARNYFLQKGLPIPAYHQNQFGASIGGPVWLPKLYNGRNKTFFFGAYQGFRYSKVQDSNLLVPTDAQYAGDESGLGQAPIYNPFKTQCVAGTCTRPLFTGNQIPTNLIDQRMVAFAKFVLPPAGEFFNNNTANAVDPTPLTQNQNEFNVRVDQNFGSKDSAWFRYSFINSTVNTSGGLPDLKTVHPIQARDWGVSYVHVFNPSLILQGQYARITVLDNSSNLFNKPTSDIISQVGFDPSYVGNFTAKTGNLLPGPGISNYANGGESVNNNPKATDSHEFSGTLTKVIGNHELKFGGGYTSAAFEAPLAQIGLGFDASGTQDPNAASGVVTGDPVASFLLNVPKSASRRNVHETTRPGGVMSFYGQDSWKAMPKLSINFGLRYDYTFIPPYGQESTVGEHGGIETGDMDFSNGTYVLQKVPPSCAVRGFAPCIPTPDGSLPDHVVVDPRGKIAHNVGTNFGPRFGFAYAADDKTVIRGAFGIVFDNWAAVTQKAQNIEGSWPDIGQQIQSNLNQATSGVPTVQAQSPLAASGSGNFPPPTPFTNNQWFYDPHSKNPYSEQWNFGIQRQITSNTAVTINYVGSGSHRTNVGGLYNTSLKPGPGVPQERNLYPYIIPTYWDRSVGVANYNALQAEVNRRLTSGFSYQISYTYSKALSMDDGWFGVEGSTAQDPYNPAGNYSVAGFDIPHVLSINSLYEIPIGKGKQFSTGNRVLDYIFGNWQINGVLTGRSGQPFSISMSTDQANTGVGFVYLNKVGNPNAVHRSANEWFNTAAFAAPAKYTFGDNKRNTLRMQTYWDFDPSIIRKFPIWERMQFEFRAEAFNALNHTVFGGPTGDINSSNFGKISSTAISPRELQLSGKITF